MPLPVAATPVAKSVSGSSSLRTPSSTPAATAGVRTAEQLDRLKLDTRLSMLLGHPHTRSTDPRTQALVERWIVDQTGQATRIQQLRTLEAAVEEDEWMYG